MSSGWDLRLASSSGDELLARGDEAVLRGAVDVGRRRVPARRGTAAMPGGDAAQEGFEILLLLVAEARTVVGHRHSAGSSEASAAGAGPSKGCDMIQ